MQARASSRLRVVGSGGVGVMCALSLGARGGPVGCGGEEAGRARQGSARQGSGGTHTRSPTYLISHTGAGKWRERAHAAGSSLRAAAPAPHGVPAAPATQAQPCSCCHPARAGPRCRCAPKSARRGFCGVWCEVVPRERARVGPLRRRPREAADTCARRHACSPPLPLSSPHSSSTHRAHTHTSPHPPTSTHLASRSRCLSLSTTQRVPPRDSTSAVVYTLLAPPGWLASSWASGRVQGTWSVPSLATSTPLPANLLCIPTAAHPRVTGPPSSTTLLRGSQVGSKHE